MDEALRLRPYVARLALDWLRSEPDTRWRRLPGSLAFVDVSGFTALTERLAVRGKAGAEEIGEVLDATFAQLLDIGYEYGAGLVKFGGDATLVFYPGAAQAPRAARAAALMVREMRQIGRLRTSVGAVNLRVSIGVHSGDIDFFLVGTSHRELLVTGPGASATARMEAAADAGQVVVSDATAALLPARHAGERKGDGILLRGLPAAPSVPARTPPDVTGLDVGLLLPAPVRAHLADADDAAHRFATAGFIQVSGVDAALAGDDATAIGKQLADVVETVSELCDRHGATLLGSDISTDGLKLIVLGGVPVAQGNDEERVLRVVRDAVSSAPDGLSLRGGVNAGRMYVGDFGPSYRRAWSVMGDAVNLAARLMAKAEPGHVIASAALVDACRGEVLWDELEPFLVKGKQDPVIARDVRSVGIRKQELAATLTLVGRDAELGVLVDAAQRLADGGLVVEVVGEPGIGKSTLLQEARRRWSIPATCLACDDYEATTPYAVARRLLREVLSGIDASDATVAEALHRLRGAVPAEQHRWLPLVEELLGLDTDLGEDIAALQPEFRRQRLEEAVVALLAAAAPEPHVFLVEDAHAADESSASLLQRVVTATPAYSWLWVISRRPVDAGFRADAAAHVRTLALAPLPASAVSVLLDLDEEALRLPAHEQEALVARAGGNPLFLKTLLSARLAAGPDFELPDTLDALLTAQIDRLSPADRRRLRAAAVLGVRFDEKLLAHVLSDYRAQLGDWQRLSTFVLPDGPGTWRFAHALVRDTAYEGLSFRDRRRLHEKAGIAIEALGGQDEQEKAALLSLHFFHAQRYDAALRYTRVAADRAMELYSNAEAAELYERAIHAAAKTDAEPALVAQLYERLGDVRYRVAELDRAAEAFAAALRRCAADPVAGAEVALKQALVKEKSADWEGAKTTVKRAKAALASRDDDQAVALRARCEAELATIHLFTGRMAQARKSAETAVALAAESDSDRALAQALATVEGLDLAEGRLSGPVEESAGARALAIYERLGDLRWQAALHQRLGMRAFGVGEWKRAMRHHQESVRLVMRMGDEVNVPGGLVNVAEVCIERGDLAAAEDLLHDAYRRLLAVQSPYVMAYCCTNRGRLEARLGRFDAALAAFAEARTCAEAGQLSWSEFAEIDARVAECEVFAGRGAQALEIVDALLAAEATDSVLRPQLLRYRGCGLVQIGDVAAGVSDLEASLEAAVSNGLVADEAAALDLLCRLYRDSQDSRGDALEQRRDELFRRLGIVSPAPVPLASVPEQPLDLLPATVQLPLDDQEPVL